MTTTITPTPGTAPTTSTDPAATAPTTSIDPAATAPTTSIDPTVAAPTTSYNFSSLSSNASGDPIIVVPVEIRPYTPFITEAGDINVIHEVTLGDLLVSTLILALISFTVISRIIRR